MSSWAKLNIKEPAPLYEVPGINSIEPIDVYNFRYSRPYTELSKPELEDPHRQYLDVLCNLDRGSSLLIFGSGHSFNMNIFYDYGRFSRLVAVDFSAAAKIGLYKEIEFYDNNILEGDLPVVCDYVFSAHTIEHFYKKELFDIVLPRLFKAARRGVVILVPYGTNWAGEPYHKCQFYENDEFASLFDKYRIVRKGSEIIFFKGETDHGF